MSEPARGASSRSDRTALPGATAVILAGGIGSRLREITDLPKPIIPVRGKPFLFYMLEALQHGGIERVVICVGYRGELVIETMRQWNPGLDLSFSVETTPLGTGGAFRLAGQKVQTELALLMNGDSMCDFDVRAFLAFHQQHPEQISILTTQVPDCSRYGRVHFDAQNRVERFEEKNPAAREGWINAGVYLLPARKLEELPEQAPLSLEREVFPHWLQKGVFAYPVQAPFLDIGTPESYREKEAFIEKLTSSFAPAPTNA